MNISMPDGLSDFVVDQVRRGGYNNQSEIVRYGLRILRARQEKLLRLRFAIGAGATDVESGSV